MYALSTGVHVETNSLLPLKILYPGHQPDFCLVLVDFDLSFAGVWSGTVLLDHIPMSEQLLVFLRCRRILGKVAVRKIKIKKEEQTPTDIDQKNPSEGRNKIRLFRQRAYVL